MKNPAAGRQQKTSGTDGRTAWRPIILAYLPPALVGIVAAFSTAIVFLWLTGYFGRIGGDLTTVPMAPLTALMFLMLSAVLLVKRHRDVSGRANFFARAVHALVLIVSLLLLAQYVRMLSTDVERLFGQAWLSASGFVVGRVSPVTAGLFAAISACGFASTFGRGKTQRAVLAADVTSAAVLLVSFVISLGYWFRAPLFYGQPAVPVALTSSVCFLLLSTSQLIDTPQHLLYRFFTSSSVSARICRSVIPLTALLVVAGTYLEENLRRIVNPELYSAVAVASFLVISTAVSAVILLVSARIDKQINRQEAALQETEEKWRSLVENIPAGIAIVSPGGRTIEVNDAMARMYGFESKDELAGSSAYDRYHNPNDRDRMLMQIRETGKVEGFEAQTSRRDGTHSWTSITSILRTMASGEQQLLSVSLDITARKQAEKQLRMAEENFRNSLDDSPLGIRIVTEQGDLLYANKAVLDMCGFESVAEMNATPSKELYTPQSYTEHELRKSLRKQGTRVPSDYEITIVRKDGAIRNLAVSRKEVTWNGQTQFQVIYQDITDRKKADEQIRSSAEEWQTTFDSIAEPISIHDRDFKLVRVNKAFADFLGMKPQEVIGQTCYSLMHGTSKPMGECPYARTLDTGRPATANFFEPHLGRHLDVTTSPVFDGAGQVFACVHVTRDVTVQRKMEEQLMLTDRLASIGMLASGIAHELNNPLTGVIGFSELLLEKELPADIRADLTIINQEAQRTAQVVKGLLTFVRQQATEKGDVDLAELLQGVLTMRAYEQRTSNIEVRTSFAAELPPVAGSRSKLQQVFINIIVNAEQAMLEAHGKGALTITASKTADMVRVSLADDGPGIAPENMRRIFSPFFTTKEVGKGTGLGLSICHGIVRDHGGKIYAESEFGKGTTFIVELPARKMAEDRA